MRSTRFLIAAVAATIPLLAEAQATGGAAAPARPGVERRDDLPPRGRGMRDGRGPREERGMRGGRGARGGPEARERREAMRAQWEAMTPAQREAAVAKVRERRAAQVTPEQRAFRDGMRAKMQELRAQVDAGTITREQMREQLRAYREANRPAPPAGGRRTPPPAPAR